MNESEKIDKYLDLARELKKKKKLRKMKVEVIPIITGVFGMVFKNM